MKEIARVAREEMRQIHEEEDVEGSEEEEY